MLLPIAHAATESAGGVAALGLDWRALVFQVINFSALLIILRLFAYRPVLRILEARRQKIEEGLRTAEEAATTKTRLTSEVEKTLAQARSKAQAMIAAAESRAETILQDAQAQAQENAEQVEKQMKARLAQEMTSVRQTLKQETLGLVALATERILGKRLDPKRDQELITEAVAAAEQAIKNRAR